MSGGWRYQPVWRFDGPDGRGENKVFSLCEVYFDDNDRLEQWTANAAIEPLASGMTELQGDLVHMLMDAYKWAPVQFDELKPGMIFQRAISQSDMEAIADMIEGARDLCEVNINEQKS